MPIKVRVTFNWREDDEEFVSHLVDELGEVASSIGHRTGAPTLPARVHCVPALVGHRIDLRMAPANAEACLGLLAGIAEAGAELTMHLDSERTD